MAINRGARASSHPTPSHSWQLPPSPLPHTHTPTPTPPPTQAHTSTRIVRSFVPLFLVCSFIRPIVHGSFVRSSDRSIVCSFVRPNNLFPALMLPKFRSFVRSFNRSSFVIVPIHRSSSLFTVHRSFLRTIPHHYSPLLFTVTIHRYYPSLLFIDHPITPNLNYSSIMLSSPPKTSQTHIPVIRTPVTVILIPVGNFPSGHPP
jgi:hypothetical protein